MEKMKLSLLMILSTCLLVLMMQSVDAFTHIVGGNHGWRVPDNTSFYDQWAKPRTFGVGDRLVFPYRPGANNLIAVKKPDYDMCEQEDPINMYFLGPTILNLSKPGDYYYYDGIGKHCEAGQKLHIQVGTKEGTSGSDPTPFDLKTFGIPTNFGSMVATPAPAPNTATTTTTAAQSGAMSYKFGLANSSGVIMLIGTMVLSMVL